MSPNSYTIHQYSQMARHLCHQIFCGLINFTFLFTQLMFDFGLWNQINPSQTQHSLLQRISQEQL